ncbi:6-bladed beta-propeller [Marinoscillum furvescens]|uniref:6-bladed beta-propeller protein n=1 Tax=Marinoscillum furvescens DSM 4134 TaxID=1122208 RepID=A0A3D9L4A1_MARFU|nr:6-bladed beta-propeller [Marinoscillum furvescens]RED98401.1 6-bladed beta-propeller protein [Marinoscillum furvescens DSM 4134]
MNLFNNFKTALLLLIISVSSCNVRTENDAYQKIPLVQNGSFLVSDFVFSIEHVQLQLSHESMVGNIDKLKVHDNKFFVLDREIAQALFVFDITGEFLFKLGQFGNGPGEFSEVTTFCLDESGRIYVYDADSYQLSIFNEKGRFERSLKFDFHAIDIEILRDEIYFYTGYAETVHGKYNIIRSNLDGDIVSKDFPFSTPVYFESSWNLHKIGDNSLRLVQSLDSKLHSFEAEGSEISYQLDFVGESMNLTDSTYDVMNLEEQLNKHSRVLDSYVENTNYLYFLFFDAYETLSCFYDKVSRELRVGALRNDLEWVPFSPMVFADHNKLVGTVMAQDIIRTRQYFESSGVEYKDEKNVFDHYFQNVKIDSNPILTIYHLRENIKQKLDNK